MKFIQDEMSGAFYPVFEPGDKVKLRCSNKDSKHPKLVDATVLRTEKDGWNYFHDRSGGGVSYALKFRNTTINNVYGFCIQYIYKRARKLERRDI